MARCCCSAAMLPARKVADAAAACISRIEALRTKAVDDLVMPRVEASKRRRFFGLLEPKPVTRDEAIAEMWNGDLHDCFDISAAAENLCERQHDVAERLLNLAKAALRSDEAATMLVSSDDFDAIESWY